jgi:hypothetical protein
MTFRAASSSHRFVGVAKQAPRGYRVRMPRATTLQGTL